MASTWARSLRRALATRHCEAAALLMANAAVMLTDCVEASSGSLWESNPKLVLSSSWASSELGRTSKCLTVDTMAAGIPAVRLRALVLATLRADVASTGFSAFFRALFRTDFFAAFLVGAFFLLAVLIVFL